MLDTEIQRSLELLILQSKAEIAAFGMLRFSMACCQSVFLHENDFAISMLDNLIAQSQLIISLSEALLSCTKQ